MPIMDQIYSVAQMIRALLGRDDAFTRPGAQVFQEFCKIPKDTIDLMKWYNVFQLNDRDYKLLGLRSLASYDSSGKPLGIHYGYRYLG